MTAGVLVIGASGYIGSAVAKAARRDGFTVYGATRNKAKAASLKADEIRPLICDPKNVDALAAVVERCEFVVDCTADYAEPNAIPDACLAAIRRSSQYTKKHYIYTSGGLVHGHHDEPVSEDDVTEHAAWRLAIERRLLAIEDVSCTVIRPAFVYGNSGGFYAKVMFSPPEDGEPLEIAGNPDKRWSWVHVDDLAKAYVDVMHRRTVPPVASMT